MRAFFGLLGCIWLAALLAGCLADSDRPKLQDISAPNGATDALFMSVLDEEGIPYTTSADAIDVAHGVCEFLAAHGSLTEATAEVMQESGLGVDQSSFFAGAAAAAYCPQYTP